MSRTLLGDKPIAELPHKKKRQILREYEAEYREKQKERGKKRLSCYVPEDTHDRLRALTEAMPEEYPTYESVLMAAIELLEKHHGGRKQLTRLQQKKLRAAEKAGKAEKA